MRAVSTCGWFGVGRARIDRRHPKLARAWHEALPPGLILRDGNLADPRVGSGAPPLGYGERRFVLRRILDPSAARRTTTYSLRARHRHLAAATVVPPLLWLARRSRRLYARRRRRRRLGLCLGCGYDLRGNISGKCSECGDKVEAVPAERRARA